MVRFRKSFKVVMAGKKGKQVTPKAQTPQPKGGSKAQKKGQTPKSEPPAKRKKLVEELDEEISDAEFEEMMSSVKASAQLKKSGKHDSEESDEGESEDITDDEDDDDSGDDDDDDEMEDDEESSDDGGGGEAGLNLSKAKLNSSKGSLTDQKMDAKTQSPKGKIAKNMDKTDKLAPAKQDVPIKSVGTTIASIGKTDIGKLKERDNRTLFIKGFPTGTTQDAIMDLSKDVIGVRLGRSMKGNKNKRSYAFLEFKSEQLAEKNHKYLLSKTIGGCKIRVDFVGDKSTQSQTQKKNAEPVQMDPLKLFVAGFGVATSADALQKLFPKCYKVDLPNNRRRNEGRGFAFVHFNKMKDCKAAHDSNKALKLGEKSIKVMYAKKRPEAQKRKATDSKKQKDVAVKKSKTEKEDGVNGNSDSEDDDDDEDLDDEDDDDDEDLEDEEEMSSGDDDEVKLNTSAAKLNKELNRDGGPKPSLKKKDSDDEEEDSDDEDEDLDDDDDSDDDDDIDLEDEDDSDSDDDDDDDDDKVELNLSEAKLNTELNRGKGPKPPLTKKAKKEVK